MLLAPNSAVLNPFTQSYSLDLVSYFKCCLRITRLHEIHFFMIDPFIFFGNILFGLGLVQNKLSRYNANTTILFPGEFFICTTLKSFCLTSKFRCYIVKAELIFLIANPSPLSMMHMVSNIGISAIINCGTLSQPIRKCNMRTRKQLLDLAAYPCFSTHHGR